MEKDLCASPGWNRLECRPVVMYVSQSFDYHRCCWDGIGSKRCWYCLVLRITEEFGEYWQQIGRKRREGNVSILLFLVDDKTKEKFKADGAQFGFLTAT